MTSKMMTGRMIQSLVQQANGIGIPWLLSSANLSLTAILHSAKRKTWLTRIRQSDATSCTLQKAKEEVIKAAARCCSLKAEKEVAKERVRARAKAKESLETYLHTPHTSVQLTAYVFRDTDLSDNLFGIAPLINLGYTATYSQTGISIDDATHHTVIYGTKHPLDNVWQFSLPKPDSHSARIVAHHKQDAELVLYASASFGSPAYQTFYHAVLMGWLTNYPGLTPKAVCRNTPHSPATAFGHITASRSNVRSSRLTPVSDSPKLALSAQPSALVKALDHYSSDELPDIVLRCTVQHSSAFRRDAIFSDLPGRFPVCAKDGSECPLLSFVLDGLSLPV